MASKLVSVNCKNEAVINDSKNSNVTVEGSGEPVEYVIVSETEDSERLELPLLPEDCSLSLNTLVHAFPGAHGLKYKNSVTGASRALLMDPQGTRFLAPPDGWKNKTFIVIYPHRGSGMHLVLQCIYNKISRNFDDVIPELWNRYFGDQNTKRKKMMDECEQEGDSEDSQGGRGGQFTAKQKRIEDPSGEKACIDLIVLGLPFKTSAETCKAYFENFGDVVLFDLKTDPSGASKGFGFVRMADFDAQQRILTQQTHEIDGRRCQVRIPLSKGDTGSPMVTRIFVGRVQEKTTVDTLRKFFNSEAAKIDSNAFVTDVFIPRPFRSFAFVNFSSPAVAKELMRQGDFIIDGSSVAVSAAAPRESDFSPRYGQSASYGLPSQGRHSRRFSDKYGYSPETVSFKNPDYASYPYDPMVSRSVDNWRANTYRSSDTRASNRFSPGYSNSPRYSTPARSGTSQALASGLDALNLNKMNVNPDMMDAAWQAFWSTLSNNSNNAGGATPSATNSNGKW
ncbi:unnamed protein product [Litomosoides sigmodontis]|uniref:RRM domain-containing protein n=1 Tax=Litomosoides sigmodontis TaxID=42156 RepID=A0A3P6U7L9_LITSI|nr:unnamed protein product [Litomosoides sigmodontis]